MHALLYFRKQIWAQSRRSMGEQPDIHARLMSKYKQVPEWWYLIIFGGQPLDALLLRRMLIFEQSVCLRWVSSPSKFGTRNSPCGHFVSRLLLVRVLAM